MRTPQPVAPNEIGLTRFIYTEPGGGQVELEDQLAQHGVPFDRIDLTQLVGMAGNAYLICYRSGKTGQNVTVLVTPHQYDVDAFGASHYYFEGLSADEARTKDWIALYDRAERLTK